MQINKSKGVTESERLLADLCEQTFLKLWSYPNPYKDDGKELCDLLVILEDTAFVFFDRTKPITIDSGKDPLVQWKRWERKVINAQIKTVHGAQRYLESGRSIYIDRSLTQLLPVSSQPRFIHKLIIAHGAADACKAQSDENVYGSLAVAYVNTSGSSAEAGLPFYLVLDNSDPVHVFDTQNLNIILGELDTVWDLSDYLVTKERAIARYEMLTYCGEEDLLAHYFLNYDESENEHIIGAKEEDITALAIGEGEWYDFVNSGTYRRTEQANKTSYLWDNLIQKTSENAIEGVLLGHSPLFERRSALHEMAKEPRFSRRALSDHMFAAIEGFPKPDGGIVRNISLMPSFRSGTKYLFLQLWASEEFRLQAEYREKRQKLLEIACGSAKNKFPDISIIVGIAVDAPKYAVDIAEDLLLMDCSNWNEEKATYYADLNKELGFFESGAQQTQKSATRFVPVR